MALAAGGALAMVLLLLVGAWMGSAVRDACCAPSGKGTAAQPLLARS